MSIRQKYRILDSTLYSKTWKDVLINELYDYIYSIGKFKELTDKGKKLRSIGRDDIKVYEELYFYKLLVDYIVNLRTAYLKSVDEDQEELELSYKLSCVRKYLFCRFKNTHIFDKLIQMANLKQDGIDFMQIGCLQDTSTEKVTNGGFDDSTGWGNLGGWVISGGVATTSYNGGTPLIRELVQSVTFDAGVTYTITFTITNYTQVLGTSYISLTYSTANSVPITGNGTFSHDITVSGPAPTLRLVGNDDFSIDNLSINTSNSLDVCDINANPFIIN